jgi:hypothetical protein
MGKKRSNRIFGMTVAQLLIIGCLVCVACGTLAGGFAFVSGANSGGGFSLLPSIEMTATSQPTFTPSPTFSPTIIPTATFIPYEELVPSGWNQYTTATIELWIPPQFGPVDVEQERKDRIEFYKNLGYEGVARELEENPPAYVFWFKQSEPGATLYVANITVEPMLMDAGNLDEFLDREYNNLPPEFIVTNRQVFQGSNYESRRVLLETNLSNVYIGAAQYAIFDGVNVWIINCGSHFNDFYTWLPEFDKVARAFRVIGQ